MPFLIRLELGGGGGGLFDTYEFMKAVRRFTCNRKCQLKSRAWKFKWEESPIANVSWKSGMKIKKKKLYIYMYTWLSVDVNIWQARWQVTEFRRQLLTLHFYLWDVSSTAIGPSNFLITRCIVPEAVHMLLIKFWSFNFF